MTTVNDMGIKNSETTAYSFSCKLGSQLSESVSHSFHNLKRNIILIVGLVFLFPCGVLLLLPFFVTIPDRDYYQVIVVGELVLGIVFVIVAYKLYSLLKKAQQLSKESEEMQDQLMHNARVLSVGELAISVANEINNPLQIIAAQSGLIKDMFDPAFNMDCSPEKVIEEVEIIKESTFRIREIVQKLMSFSKKGKPHFVPCDINILIADFVSGFIEKDLAVSNIELIQDLDPKLPNILIDPQHLRQVLLNIINNAAEAIVSAGTITLRTRKVNQELRIIISDTGQGMIPEQMGKLFLPFYTSREEGKAGLGLAISLNIIESMGGRIEVSSTPRVGSEFTIVLPVSKHVNN